MFNQPFGTNNQSVRNGEGPPSSPSTGSSSAAIQSGNTGEPCFLQGNADGGELVNNQRRIKRPALVVLADNVVAIPQRVAIPFRGVQGQPVQAAAQKSPYLFGNGSASFNRDRGMRRHLSQVPGQFVRSQRALKAAGQKSRQEGSAEAQGSR